MPTTAEEKQKAREFNEAIYSHLDQLKLERETSGTGSKILNEVDPSNKAKQAEDTYSSEQSTLQQEPYVMDTVTVEGNTPTSIEEVSPQSKPEMINVVDEYDWTLSVNKGQLAAKVPRIILTEFNLTASNVMQSLYSGLMAWSDLKAANASGVQALGGIAGSIAKDTGLTNFLNPENDSKLTSYLKGIGTATADMAGKAVEIVSNEADKALAYAKSKFPQHATGFGAGGSSLVELYGDIYTRQKSGKSYMLPYFTEEFLSVNNSFRDTYQIDTFGLERKIEGVIQAYQQIPALVEPGVYVQRPKFYQFNADNVAVHRISFSLFNTVTPMAYIENATFIQKLALSNMPRRKTRVVVDPPCIYEVLIPGKAFHPYCYIQDMTVNHRGTKRVINGETIPEAYNISITLVSLLSEASNFYEAQMIHSDVGEASIRDSRNNGSGLSDIASGIGSAVGSSIGRAANVINGITGSVSNLMGNQRSSVIAPQALRTEGVRLERTSGTLT